MRNMINNVLTAVSVLVCAVGLEAQQTQASAPITTVPRVVRITTSFHPANGLSAGPVESVTLSIYKDEQGGIPLWQETQNVSVDGEGRYSALMGSTLPDGVPADLFVTGEPRWLGVQFNRPGEAEQPRVLLVSVPYALKASDADTLGGRPASAYLLDPNAPVPVESASGAFTAPPAAGSPRPAVTSKSPSPHAISGSAGYLPYFTDSSNDLGNSVVYQAGSRVGLNTTSPFDYLHVQFTNTTGAFTGYAVQNLGSTSTSYSGMLFFDQNGALGQFQGFNNGTHEYRINNIASSGTINFMIGSSSKFYVGNNGNIGIGTSTPAANLDVAGNINFSGSVLYQGTSVFSVPGGAANGNTGAGLAALFSNSTGVHNTATGYQALTSNTTGNFNTAVGYQALGFNTIGSSNAAVGGLALSSNSTGSNDTAIGFHALQANTTGNANTAVGGSVLVSNTSGNNNTAVGQAAMGGNTTGCCNVAVGQAALTSNTAGNSNTALGGSALQNNTTGNNNTAVGQASMNTNTTGCCNSAIGQDALGANTSGNANAATGGSALQDNTTGSNNTADGQASLLNNTTGYNNTAAGQNAMNANTTGCCNVAVGTGALASNTTANGNTAVGAGALGKNTGTQNVAVGTGALGNNTTGLNDIAIGWGAASNVAAGNSSNIHIGTGGSSTDGSTIRIGGGTSGIADGAIQTAFFAAGIRGATTGNNDAIPVVIDSAGQLGTVSSSRRVKQDIVDMGDTTDIIMSLRPVRFRYKTHGPSGPQQYGLIADEVAEVAPDLVAHTQNGEIETVYYDKVNAMLLNQVQKQQRLIEEQSRILADQSARIQELETRMAELQNHNR